MVIIVISFMSIRKLSKLPSTTHITNSGCGGLCCVNLISWNYVFLYAREQSWPKEEFVQHWEIRGRQHLFFSEGL